MICAAPYGGDSDVLFGGIWKDESSGLIPHRIGQPSSGPSLASDLHSADGKPCFSICPDILYFHKAFHSDGELNTSISATIVIAPTQMTTYNAANRDMTSLLRLSSNLQAPVMCANKGLHEFS